MLKTAGICLLFLAGQNHPASDEFYYSYWTSAALVLAILFSVHLETLGRIVTGCQLQVYKFHMQELLNMSFDACLWIDRDMNVVDGYHKLHELSLNPTCAHSGASPVKLKLSDWVVASDRSRFNRYFLDSRLLRGSKIKSSPAVLFHTELCNPESLNQPSFSFPVDMYITNSTYCPSGVSIAEVLEPREGEFNLVGIKLRAVQASHIVPPALCSDWECPSCRCVNAANTLDCVLCGNLHDETNQIFVH